MGLVMGFTAVIVGIVAALAGLVVWTALIFPRPAGRARVALEGRPGRCFVTGVLVSVLIGGPVVALLHSPNGLAKIGGWVAAFPLLGVLVLGLTAMAQLLGDRLRSLSPAVTELGGLVRGALILELAMLLPVFGWFLFAPLVGISLVGAGVLSAMPERLFCDGFDESHVSMASAGSTASRLAGFSTMAPTEPATSEPS